MILTANDCVCIVVVWMYRLKRVIGLTGCCCVLVDEGQPWGPLVQVHLLQNFAGRRSSLSLNRTEVDDRWYIFGAFDSVVTSCDCSTQQYRAWRSLTGIVSVERKVKASTALS